MNLDLTDEEAARELRLELGVPTPILPRFGPK